MDEKCNSGFPPFRHHLTLSLSLNYNQPSKYRVFPVVVKYHCSMIDKALQKICWQILQYMIFSDYEKWPQSRGYCIRTLARGGDVQPNPSRLEAVYAHSLIINPYLGMYQEIHPCRAVSIGSVKINTSLLMMRE